jgi:hypothetical protein
MTEHEQPPPEAADTLPAGGERRAVARLPCGRHGPTRLVVQHGPAAHWARPRDVSVHGIGLVLAHPVEAGSALTIRLRPRSDRPARSLAVSVVHARGGPDGTWLVGCAFDRALTPDELDQFL